MERTQIINTIGDEDTDGQINWRRRFGRPQLLCPKCYQWFSLGRDFKIDDQGNVDAVVYHVCDDDASGWVVLPQLVGWGQRS
jgi:hypothetical protein